MKHTWNLPLALFLGFIMPAGMLFGYKRTLPRVSSPTANWADTQEAGHLFRQIRDQALKAQKTLGTLNVEGIYLNWQDQAQSLNIARSYINKIGADLLRLKRMNKGLAPWQQRVVAQMTPAAHEMVYQMDQAVKEINRHQNSVVLAMTPYPQNINIIGQQAGRMVRTIQTYSQYAHAEERLAALQRKTATSRS